MPLLDKHAYDNGLTSLAEADRIFLTSAEPANFAAVSGLTLATKTTPTIGSVGDGSPNGRSRLWDAITDMAANVAGDASHWAAVDNANSRLLATSDLSAVQAIVLGTPVRLTAAGLRFPDTSGWFMDGLYDFGFNALVNNSNLLHFCSSLPTTFAGVTAVSLGTKTNPVFGASTANAGGYQSVMTAFTDGVGTTTGTVSHIAVTDTKIGRAHV